MFFCHWVNPVKYPEYTVKCIGRKNSNYSWSRILSLIKLIVCDIIMTTKYILLFPLSLPVSFFFFSFFMIVKYSSVRLDKILINCRRGLMWLACVLQVNKNSNPGVLPALLTWDLCVKALSLRHCTTQNKYSLIHCSDGCLSYCAITHHPLQTLTPFHSTLLHWTVLLAIAAFYWVGEKNKQKIPRKE